MGVEQVVTVPAKVAAKATLETGRAVGKVAVETAKKSVEVAKNAAKRGAEVAGKSASHAKDAMLATARRSKAAGRPHEGLISIAKGVPTEAHAAHTPIANAEGPVARHPAETARRIAPRNESTTLAQNHARSESQAIHHPNEAVRRETPVAETHATRLAKADRPAGRQRLHPHTYHDRPTRLMRLHDRAMQGSGGEEEDKIKQNITVIHNEKPIIKIVNHQEAA